MYVYDQHVNLLDGKSISLTYNMFILGKKKRLNRRTPIQHSLTQSKSESGSGSGSWSESESDSESDSDSESEYFVFSRCTQRQ
jgi:hypothetical protein